MSMLETVARFNANSDRANLNCNWDPQDSDAELGITHYSRAFFIMKTYKKLYEKICSIENLELAFKKARKGKAKMPYVKAFGNNLEEEIQKLHEELSTFTYKPLPLKKFIVREPKTRTIHASAFRDRVVYHAIVNILEPTFEKILIHDSYASRENKGTHKAVERLEKFIRKVSRNGKLVNNYYDQNNIIGYALKADIKHYFQTVDHEIL